MDRLERIRVLIDVAERRSFSAAARARRTSAAAVSRAVAALELELGVALLRRTTRHVALTPEGAAFVEECGRAIDLLPEDKILLHRSDTSFALLRPTNRDYFEVLRTKLKWGTM